MPDDLRRTHVWHDRVEQVVSATKARMAALDVNAEARRLSGDTGVSMQEIAHRLAAAAIRANVAIDFAGLQSSVPRPDDQPGCRDEA